MSVEGPEHFTGTVHGHLLPLVLLQSPQKTQKPLPGFTEERLVRVW